MVHFTITKKSVKSIRIKINPNGTVSVTAPLSCSDEQVAELVEKKEKRIQKKLSLIKKAKTELAIDVNEIVLHGRNYRFHLDAWLGDKVVINNDNHSIRSGVDLRKKVEQEKRYQEYAKTYLTEKLEKVAREYRLSYNKIFIRDQKTRRGTCSSDKHIGLNRRLVKMPDYIAQYVICHELAHLHEMNHGPKFRALVDKIYPDKERAMDWLKQYGMVLY
jgi:predicted metal-dependent hydrolase